MQIGNRSRKAQTFTNLIASRVEKMPELISGNCLEAWRKVATSLLKNRGELYAVTSTIHNPSRLDESWLADYCPSKYGSNDTLKNVINTVFPIRMASRCNSRDELYDRYVVAQRRLKGRNRGRAGWGTYFGRLIDFGEQHVNQLEVTIEKIGSWPNRATTPLVLHLTSPEIEAPRPRSGPCWQYGQILWHADSTLDLVAVYRNHDFFQKALGNYIALGNLLEFIARSTKKRVGKVVCISVRAYSEGGQARLKRLARL